MPSFIVKSGYQPVHEVSHARIHHLLPSLVYFQTGIKKLEPKKKSKNKFVKSELYRILPVSITRGLSTFAGLINKSS